MVQMKISCNASVLYEDANANVCTCNASVLNEDANANVYALWCIDLPQHDIVDVNETKWWCKWKLFVLQISCRKIHMWMLCMWCKCLNQYLWEIKNSLQHFCSKSRLSCLILNFGNHHQEFFRVRSIWCFEKFSSASLDLFPKISQFDWKWDIWKLFLGLAHEFSTIEHRKKEIFVLVNFKQIQCSFFMSWT